MLELDAQPLPDHAFSHLGQKISVFIFDPLYGELAPRSYREDIL